MFQSNLSHNRLNEEVNFTEEIEEATNIDSKAS